MEHVVTSCNGWELIKGWQPVPRWQFCKLRCLDTGYATDWIYSTETVSRVLDALVESMGMTPETRDTLLDAAKGLGLSEHEDPHRFPRVNVTV